MSADLFSEFNNLSHSPPAAQDRTSRGQPSQHQGWAQESQDPLDFGHSSDSPAQTSQSTQQWLPSHHHPSGMDSWSSLTHQPARLLGVSDQAVEDDEDGWGDFEVAESTATDLRQSLAPKGAREPPPIKGITRVPTIDLMTNVLVHVEQLPPSASDLSSPRSPPKTKPKLEAAPKDPNVLFDADDFELQGVEGDDDADEFGDFASAAQPCTRARPAPAAALNIPSSMDLLGLDDPLEKLSRQPLGPVSGGALSFGASSSSRTPTPRLVQYQDGNSLVDFSAEALGGTDLDKKSKGDLPVAAWPSAAKSKTQTAKDEHGEWAAWGDFARTGTKPEKDVSTTQPATSWDWDAVEGCHPSAAVSSDNDPPPTNVPPPSVILSAFSDLLSSGGSLLKPIVGQSSSITHQILSNPKAIEFLQGYVLVGTTAARVIAGRKHRWHRDMLTKSMSISAAGSNGMKLAGVDKTQSAREDREAADVVAAWREHIGRLRAAVAAVNKSERGKTKVPELSENMQIHTAKLVPTAGKPCIICGLKREERVAKVDYDVEDSFGEWWVEHWGHRTCKNFWVEHEQRLRQR